MYPAMEPYLWWECASSEEIGLSVTATRACGQVEYFGGSPQNRRFGIHRMLRNIILAPRVPDLLITRPDLVAFMRAYGSGMLSPT